MAGKSDALENSILDHVLGGPDYTRLSTVYLAIYTAAPTDGTAGTESFSYQRVALPNDSTTWNSASGGVKTNKATLVFSFQYGGGTTGPFTHFAITASSTFGANDILFWGAFASPLTINGGDLVSIPPGGLVITEN